MSATALVRRADSVRDGDVCKKKETDYLRLRKTLGGVRFELIWQKAADNRFDLEAVLARDATDSAEYSLLAKRTGGAAAGRVFQDGRAFFERLSFRRLRTGPGASRRRNGPLSIPGRPGGESMSGNAIHLKISRSGSSAVKKSTVSLQVADPPMWESRQRGTGGRGLGKGPADSPKR